MRDLHLETALLGFFLRAYAHIRTDFQFLGWRCSFRRRGRLNDRKAAVLAPMQLQILLELLPVAALLFILGSPGTGFFDTFSV